MWHLFFGTPSLSLKISEMILVSLVWMSEPKSVTATLSRLLQPSNCVAGTLM